MTGSVQYFGLFELDDHALDRPRARHLDAAVARARALFAEVVEHVHVNPAPGHREMWLRDARSISSEAPLAPERAPIGWHRLHTPRS